MGDYNNGWEPWQIRAIEIGLCGGIAAMCVLEAIFGW